MLKEFKEFIARGNVMDMAVGVIIGSAFGKIVSSLVDNVLMPFIGILIGGIDFTSLTLKINDATIAYGTFIQSIIDFLIIAACIFLMTKILNKLDRKKEEPKKEEPKKSDEVVLLEEIRDLLKKNTKKDK
jgi:large conductance mechanosensitive channel